MQIFSEAEIKTSELTTKPVLKSSKNIKDRFNMDWWLKEQLNKKVTLSHPKAGIDECNPFAIRDGKDYRFFMTMCSAQDQEMDIDPKTNELLYKRCSMSNITELTPEGAAYAAIVKGSGEILSVIPEEVSDRLFNRIGLSHVSVSFVDFKNSQKIISQLTDYVLEGCLGVSERTLRGYPALSKTPFKNGIQRMDAYLAKQSA